MAQTPAKKARQRNFSRKSKSARSRILETANKLFYQQGSRAVGIDAVIAESGVAKMSLYRSFRSKDELIAAWLEERNKEYWGWFDHVLAKHTGNPREQLREILHAMAERTVTPNYRGCPFLNTALDYEDAKHPSHDISVRHKRTLLERMIGLCEQVGTKDPQALAQQLVLLVNGAQATANMLGPSLQLQLTTVADILIDRALAHGVADQNQRV